MSKHDHRGHSHHAHDHHGPVVHSPAAGAAEAYRSAFEAAQPDPGRCVLRVDLEAREVDWSIAPGAGIKAWTFNGRVPGPTLEGRVGDVLEVHFTNRLSEPTTVHWHGLRIPAPMDGTDLVQRPVPPGHSFVYRFRLPDAGTFWYHPHSHETVQMERGLYGALLVHGDDEPVLDGDRILVLDNLELDQRRQLANFGGSVEPELTIAAGQIERWRIINASGVRYARLSIGGAPFQIVGSDVGLIDAPVTASEVLLAPAERIELAVGPFEEGECLAIESLATIERLKPETFATLRVGPARPSAAVIPSRLRSIEPLATAATPPTRTVDFGVQYRPKGGLDFVINREMHHRDAPVRVGELQVWDIVNSSTMDHPFHLHGFAFQVLAVDGMAPGWAAWKDVVNLKPGSTTRIAWMPDDRLGSWMYHCHILEHHEGGMMAHFEVVR